MLEQILKLFQKPVEAVDDKIVVHQNYSLVKPDFINYKPKISRNVITQEVLDKYDFIDFINEYKNDRTKIFYNQSRIKAVFNYPTATEADYADSWCQMPLVTTLNFQEFKNSLDQKLSQKQFILMLKRLEPFIVAFDGKKVDGMDIIEVAENLQATKNINSIQRNTQQKYMLDIKVSAGNSQFTIPRYITFEIPVYKNDLMIKTQFQVELFLTSGDGGFEAQIVCYKLEQLVDEALKELTKQVQSGIDRVGSFMS